MFKKLLLSAVTVLLIGVCITARGKKDDPVKSAEDLEGRTIGVQLGTTGEMLASDIKDAKVEKYSSGEDAVKKLKDSNLDAVIIDAEPAKVFAEKYSEIKVLDDKFAQEDYAIAVNLQNTELCDSINKALSELKSEGVIDSIVKNYIGNDKGKSPYISPEGTDRSKGTLTMATNAEFPPYEALDTDRISGIDVDIMTAICDKLGYTLKIEDMSFDSVLPSVQEGKVDVGMSGITVTDERMQQVLFSDPYTTSTQVILTRKD